MGAGDNLTLCHISAEGFEQRTQRRVHKKIHVGGWIGAQEQKVPCVALQSNHFITLDVALPVFFLPFSFKMRRCAEACVVHRFLDICALKRACWIKYFYSVPSLPSSIWFSWLSNKQCSCHSELQIPSSVQARGGKRVVECRKGARRFFGNIMKGTARLWVFLKFRPTCGC